MRADFIQEVAIVRDHDQTAVISQQVLLQPVNGLKIEVVRRFIQQQDGRIAEERLGQEDSHFLAALHLRHLSLVELSGNVEALQQGGGVWLGCVATVVTDDALEFADPHAIFIGPIGGVVVELVPFLQGFPENRVAHHHRVDHSIGIEGELVLAKNADAFRACDRTFGGLQFAGQDFHERRFAGAIGAGNRVAASSLKGRVDLFKQNSGAEAHS